MRQLAAEILDRARAEGFADAGICRPEAVRDAGLRLRRWLELGHAGTMDWMSRRLDWRADPTRLWPEARSVIMLAENYGPEDDPLATLDERRAGTISVYARGRDYHDIVKKRLKRLGRWLIAREPCEIKVFVDTAPVMEKPLGQAAGLGWQGKHTNLVSRRLGSWFFLGAIFTTLELPESGAEVDHCGRCRRCLDACPTRAFPQPYLLDARRCISYLTIEHKGPVDVALRPALGNRIYGCDDCLAVCPWNKFAKAAQELRYHARPGTVAPRLDALASLDDGAFRERFAGTPIKRIGRDRFVRNVAYAIGNSGDTGLAPAARHLAADGDPVVAEAGAWALARLGVRS